VLISQHEDVDAEPEHQPPHAVRSIEDGELRWMIDHSHGLVVANLPRTIRERFRGS
jgi:hypothetical protein